MLDITELTVFSYIAELGSISGAARLLKMPKSSVSRSLVRLEETMGMALVERSTRHLRLTDAGLLLKRHVRRILDEVGEAENAMAGLVGVPVGDLHVDAPFTFATGPLAAMLPAFVRSYPDIRVVLSVNNKPIDVQLEQMDVVIRIGPLQDSELIARRLATFSLWPCASPAYLAQHAKIERPEDLTNHRWISHADRRQVLAFRGTTGGVREVEVPPGIVIPEPEVMKTMLIAGLGIGLLPDFHASDAVADGRLVRLLPSWTTPSVDAHALYPSHRSLSAKVRVFVDGLVAHFAKNDQDP
jgi:DNA-binding transcriptional LysR family regulator